MRNEDERYEGFILKITFRVLHRTKAGLSGSAFVSDIEGKRIHAPFFSYIVSGSAPIK